MEEQDDRAREEEIKKQLRKLLVEQETKEKEKEVKEEKEDGGKCVLL